MKYFVVFILAVFISAGTSFATGFSAKETGVSLETTAAKPKSEVREVVFNVSMHCESCVKKIRENISFEKGVKALDVSLDNHKVTIKYDPSKTDEASLKTALEKLGYKVEKQECSK